MKCCQKRRVAIATFLAVIDILITPAPERKIFVGSATLDQHARAILVALAAELNKSQNPDRRFLIGGHTDATGGAAYNQLLSERRAASVKRFLVTCCGVDRTMLATVGFGKQLPKNMADPYADENRRVNINALSAIHEQESER